MIKGYLKLDLIIRKYTMFIIISDVFYQVLTLLKQIIYKTNTLEINMRTYLVFATNCVVHV